MRILRKARGQPSEILLQMDRQVQAGVQRSLFATRERYTALTTMLARPRAGDELGTSPALSSTAVDRTAPNIDQTRRRTK
jgi:hypothetical protein